MDIVEFHVVEEFFVFACNAIYVKLKDVETIWYLAVRGWGGSSTSDVFGGWRW